MELTSHDVAGNDIVRADDDAGIALPCIDKDIVHEVQASGAMTENRMMKMTRL